MKILLFLISLFFPLHISAVKTRSATQKFKRFTLPYDDSSEYSGYKPIRSRIRKQKKPTIVIPVIPPTVPQLKKCDPCQLSSQKTVLRTQKSFAYAGDQSLQVQVDELSHQLDELAKRHEELQHAHDLLAHQIDNLFFSSDDTHVSESLIAETLHIMDSIAEQPIMPPLDEEELRRKAHNLRINAAGDQNIVEQLVSEVHALPERTAEQRSIKKIELRELHTMIQLAFDPNLQPRTFVHVDRTPLIRSRL